MTTAGWSLLVAGVAAIYLLVTAVLIVLQRRSPAATIAWLMVLAFLPVIGWIVYRLIGPLRLERRKLRRRANRRVVEEAIGALAEIESESPMLHREQLAKVAIAAGEVPPLRADEVTVYVDGETKYRAVADAIDAARHHVHVEYYIWEPDRIGTRLRDQLVAKARAGVQVRVIVDGTGSFGLRKGFLKPIVAAGGEIAWFNPVSLLRLRRKRADFRTHRKIVVCDGTVGFTGGMNVADAHSAEFAGATAWRDTHIKITGSAVRALQRIFVEDWLYCSDKQLASDETYFPTPATTTGEVVQIVASGPDTAAFAVHKMFFAAINQAIERIWLTTPYFVPDDPILDALKCAAMRGVDVQVIVPERGDSRLVDLAARSYFPEILAAGVRVFEYRERFVHAKTFVVDDDLAIVGTANLDNRSFRLNFEVAAVVYGGAINAQLDHAFRRDLESCRELRVEFWERQKLLSRLGQSGARLLSPLL